MRPPIMWLAVAFGVGLGAGLVAFRDAGSGMRDAWVAVPVLVAALGVARTAPLGAAVGIMGVAGVLWGGAAVRERDASCAGMWAGETGNGKRETWTRAAIVRLVDPVPDSGGLVDAEIVDGTRCGGALRIRWPERPARGGTTWVVAGPFLGDAARGLLVARRVLLLDPLPRGRGAWRDRVVTRAQSLFGSRTPLVEALLLARRTDLDPAVRDRYAQAGLAHILVIAGLHVGFLAGWIGVLLRALGARPARAMWITTAALAGYVWLLGLPSPATRAALMFLLHALARWRQRVVAPRGLLSLTALLLMALDPWALQSAGAWLSFAAVGAVIWAGRATAQFPKPVQLVAPTVAATLATAPITALTFGTVAPIGVLANLVAIPVASIAVPGLAVALVTSWVLPPLAALFAAGSGLGLALLDVIARAAAAVPGGHLVMEAGWRAAGVWLAVLIVAWWLWNSPRRPWLITARIAFASTVFLSTSLLDVVSLASCRCLTVFFLDVGQGDAELLRTPAGRWVEIDGGPRGPTGDAGKRIVVPFLRRERASLAVLVATHGDADHLGGLPAVIGAFPPALVLEPGEPLGRPLYLEFLAAVEASGARYRPARAGDRLELDGVTLEVLSPDSAWLGTPADVNDHGVVVRVTYGGERILFQADAGLPVEARLAGRVGRVDVLKVGHHGSHSASSDAWLTELAPRVAVISVGRRNNYGHPAPEVVARLAAHGIRVLRTDRDGTITLTTDGTSEQTDIQCQVSSCRVTPSTPSRAASRPSSTSPRRE